MVFPDVALPTYIFLLPHVKVKQAYAAGRRTIMECIGRGWIDLAHRYGGNPFIHDGFVFYAKEKGAVLCI